MSKAGAKILSLEIVVCPVVICLRLSLYVHTHLLQKMDSFVKNDLWFVPGVAKIREEPNA